MPGNASKEYSISLEPPEQASGIKTLKKFAGKKWVVKNKKDQIQQKSAQIERQASRIKELEKEAAKLQEKSEEDNKKRREQSVVVPLLLQYPNSKHNLKVSAEENIQKFLNHVAAGDQSKAEDMLKINPKLASASGTVTDHAERTFKNITGFQYAVWALDWQMWEMIIGYLSRKAARKQLIEFEGSWVKEQGEHVYWKELMDAYQALMDNFESWSWDEINKYWVQKIGGAQRLLPIHVLQEYNQPGRAFDPSPDFRRAYELSRRMLPMALSDIGTTQVLVRGGLEGQALNREERLLGIDMGFLKADRDAVVDMFSIRKKQRLTLVKLLKSPGYNRRIRPAPSHAP